MVVMSKINRFEYIEAWEKARKLVGAIYELTNSGRFSKDYALRDQIRRAATSIMLNIAEGFARRTDKEFAQFLFVAMALWLRFSRCSTLQLTRSTSETHYSSNSMSNARRFHACFPV